MGRAIPYVPLLFLSTYTLIYSTDHRITAFLLIVYHKKQSKKDEKHIKSVKTTPQAQKTKNQ